MPVWITNCTHCHLHGWSDVQWWSAWVLQTEDEDGPDNQLINSVYLDNSSMELYHGRLDKKPNALAIRIRCRSPHLQLPLKKLLLWLLHSPVFLPSFLFNFPSSCLGGK